MEFCFVKSKDSSNASYETEPSWFKIYDILDYKRHFVHEYEMKVTLRKREHIVALGSLMFCKQMAYKYADMLDDITAALSLDRNSVMPLPVSDQYRLWDLEEKCWSRIFNFKDIKDAYDDADTGLGQYSELPGIIKEAVCPS